MFAMLAAISLSGCDHETQSHHHDDAGAPAPTHEHGAVVAQAADHDIDPDHDHDHDHGLAADHDHDHDHAHDAALMHPWHDPSAACVCDEVRTTNGWCPRCDTGYVAGVEVESEQLFETLDPHGHDLAFSTIRCESCRAAMGPDGWCDSCRMGYVRGQVYFTPLTHAYAKGRVVDPGAHGCQRCVANSASLGWCEDCHRGLVGVVAFYDRDTFALIERERRTLVAAIAKVPDCEQCACAMVVHGTCPRCLINYGTVGAAPSAPGPETESETAS